MKYDSTAHQSFNKVFSESESPVILTTGSWKDISWQFILANEGELPPPSELCTAAFCVVTFRKRLILIEHATRGAEFPGGHREVDEDVFSAVKREALEEAGAIILNPIFFGYKKISPPKPIAHRDVPGASYPFLHSYIPYFYAEAKGMFYTPSNTEVHSVHLVTVTDAQRLLAPGQKHEVILEYLLKEKLIDVK